MPIDTRCPHCQKAYRLKDEFLGRKVKCPNPECQKPFAVEPLPVEAAPKPKPAAPKKSAAELEAEAAALLNDAPPPNAAADTRTVAMLCASCDHKWEVPFDKKGKNVICPECKFTQKVPDKKEKKIDWRDPNADRPSMAKGEEVPEDLKAQMARDVTFGALEKAGAVKDDVEPVPLTVTLQRIAVVLGVVAAVAFGVLYFMQSRQENKEQQFLDDAVAEVEKVTDEGMAKGQPPLLKAVIMAAAAEHALRNDTPDQRKLALERFGIARQLVEQAPARTPERDVLLGQFAVLIIKFGGTDEQIGTEVRLRWQPAGRGVGAQLNAGLGDVQTELKRLLVGLNGSDLDFRLSVVRRVTAALEKVKHVELLTEILGQGFSAAEMPEAAAHMGLELHRGGNAAAAKRAAEQAKALMAGNPSPAAQALCEVAGVALDAKEKLYSVPQSGPLAYFNRVYGVILSAANKDIATATAVATRGGADQTDEKLRALATVADWAENPSDAAAKAEAILSGEGRGRSKAGYALLRLATAAGKGGQLDLADKLIVGIEDEGLRVWAKAEAIRAKLGTIKEQKAELSLVEQTLDKGKIRAGHARTAVTVARHNAAATGDQSAAKEYAAWTEPVFRACGLAGLALGIQDRKK